MDTIIILFCLFAALTGYIIERNIFNPITLFFTYWAGVLLLVIFGGYYGANVTSTKAYLIIFIGLVSFYVGCLFYYRIDKKYELKQGIEDKGAYDYELRYKLLYVIYGIVILFLLYNSKTIFEILKEGGSFKDVRKLYTNREEYNIVRKSPLNVVFKNFVSTPVVYLSLPVAVVDFFSGKRNKPLLYMTFTMALLWFINSGGRSVLLWLAMYFVIAMLIYRKQFKLSKKIIYIVGGLVLALTLLLLFTTSLRKGAFSLVREVFIYFAAPIPHFDYRISVINEMYPNVFGFGVSSLNGFIYPILFFLNNLGLMPYPDAYLLIRHLSFEELETVVDIGVRMNAFATMFYQLYLDGRILGVVVGSSVFGAICNWAYVKMKSTMNQFMVVFYLVLIQKLLFSVVRFYYYQPSHAIGLVLLFFIFKKTMKPPMQLEMKGM
jgi:oligosaccharide repeat unit polymerase